MLNRGLQALFLYHFGDQYKSEATQELIEQIEGLCRDSTFLWLSTQVPEDTLASMFEDYERWLKEPLQKPTIQPKPKGE